MADTLNFELVSPAAKLAASEAESVTIPGMEGDLTAMANHAPFLTTLRPGYVIVRSAGGEERFMVTGGFAEISDNTVSVLAELAATGEAVDEAWIDARIAEAEEALAEAGEERKQAAQQRLNDFIALKTAA